MSNINKINAIPFEDILSHLGLRYKLKWDVVMMMGEDGNITDWRRGSISKGFLKCHSWKKAWRIEGDRITLIMDYLNTTEERKAFEWYEKLNWHNKDGKPVVVWQTTMRNNWFKEKNKNRQLPKLWTTSQTLNWKPLCFRQFWPNQKRRYFGGRALAGIKTISRSSLLRSKYLKRSP